MQLRHIWQMGLECSKHQNSGEFLTVAKALGLLPIELTDEHWLPLSWYPWDEQESDNVSIVYAIYGRTTKHERQASWINGIWGTMTVGWAGRLWNGEIKRHSIYWEFTLSNNQLEECKFSKDRMTSELSFWNMALSVISRMDFGMRNLIIIICHS